jgi:hypothetical protein
MRSIFAALYAFGTVMDENSTPPSERTHQRLGERCMGISSWIDGCGHRYGHVQAEGTLLLARLDAVLSYSDFKGVVVVELLPGASDPPTLADRIQMQLAYVVSSEEARLQWQKLRPMLVKLGRSGKKLAPADADGNSAAQNEK